MKCNEVNRNQHTSHQHISGHFHKAHPEDNKTKKHDEDDLPPEFKKKLTEWEIGKAMVGKSQQNVEELQKNLGEEFNRKMAEWEKIKASGGGAVKSTSGVIVPSQVGPQTVTSISSTTSQGMPSHQMNINSNLIGPLPPVAPLAGISELHRKGSANKLKKSKGTKTDKPPIVSEIYNYKLLSSYDFLIVINI